MFVCCAYKSIVFSGRICDIGHMTAGLFPGSLAVTVNAHADSRGPRCALACWC